MSFTICNKFLLSSLTLLLVYLPEMFIRLPQVSPVFLQPSLSGSLTETGLLLHPVIWIFWKHYFWFQHRQLIIHIYDLQSQEGFRMYPVREFTDERQNASSDMGILDTPVFLLLKHIAWICVQKDIKVLCFGEKVGSRRNH